MAIKYEIRQHVKTVLSAWLEDVYSSPCALIATIHYERLKKENPGAYFELVKIEEHEECLAHSGTPENGFSKDDNKPPLDHADYLRAAIFELTRMATGKIADPKIAVEDKSDFLEFKGSEARIFAVGALSGIKACESMDLKIYIAGTAKPETVQ